MSSPAPNPTSNPFDWRSLLTPAITLGVKAIGDKLAPSADLQAVQNNNTNARANLAEQQRQFNIQNQLAQQKLGQSNMIRQSIMPGMYTQLGFSPEQGQKMTADYAAKFPVQPSNPPVTAPGTMPGIPGGDLALQPKAPGLGSQIGKGAVGVGLGLAPGLIGGALHGIGAGTMTGMAGALGATGMATLGIGTAAALGALAWKKSQVHPTADIWVQNMQNPFDRSMAAIDQSQASPEEKKVAKQQNVQNYLSSLQQFEKQGGHESIVAKQSANTFRQWYGDPAQYGVQLGF